MGAHKELQKATPESSYQLNGWTAESRKKLTALNDSGSTVK